MTIRPTKGNVFIEPIEEKRDPGSRIILPEVRHIDGLPRYGRIVAMGGKLITKKGVTVEPEFKIGDTVYMRKYTALIVEVDGKTLLMVKQHDIEAIVTEE